ncbi:MAG TPA: NUDIX domain-containing protein, partial [Catenuloplanes sp.]
RGGTPQDEVGGTTDRVAWFSPDEAAALPLMPFTAAVLGLPPQASPETAPAPGDDPTVGPAPAPGDDPAAGAVPGTDPAPAVEVAPRPATGRRFSAYGLVTDPAGRVLLTLIADGYPGAGRWHLPGGGTDHGEQPDAALRREVMEEAGQLGRITALLDVSHRHDPAALGPEGHPIDWHVVRVLFRMVVDEPTDPVVTEAAGGSTLRSGWFAADRSGHLPTTELARAALRRLAPADRRPSP